jgi:hypothetical protein
MYLVEVNTQSRLDKLEGSPEIPSLINHLNLLPTRNAYEKLSRYITARLKSELGT